MTRYYSQKQKKFKIRYQRIEENLPESRNKTNQQQKQQEQEPSMTTDIIYKQNSSTTNIQEENKENVQTNNQENIQNSANKQNGVLQKNNGQFKQTIKNEFPNQNTEQQQFQQNSNKKQQQPQKSYYSYKKNQSKLSKSGNSMRAKPPTDFHKQKTKDNTDSSFEEIDVEEKESQQMEEEFDANQQEKDDIRKYNMVFKHTYSELYTIKQVGGVVVDQKRYYKLNDTRYKMRKNKNYKFLLPQKKRDVLKTIVLDMDETLIFSFPEVYTNKDTFYYKTVLRPYLLEFLRELRPHYEIVLFTAAEEDYTRRILLGFGLMEYFDELLFRQHMTPTDIEYVDDEDGQARRVCTKDLEFLGRQLKHVCIIDDKKQRFERQPNNGIEIPKWFGRDKKDTSLLLLKKFFKGLAENEETYQKFNFAKGSHFDMKLNYQEISKFIQSQNL